MRIPFPMGRFPKSVLPLLLCLAGCPAPTPTLDSLEVTPIGARIAIGTRQQFVATGLYSDASKRDLTASSTWSSSNLAIADVSSASGSAGLAEGVGLGTASITATSGGVSGSRDLTVTAATLVSLALTPSAPSIACGTQQQFTAMGLFTDGSRQDLTAQVTWTSSDAAVATLSDAPGLFTGMGEGSAVIKATFGDASATMGLTVTAATLVTLSVTALDSSLARGTTLQLTATGIFSDGTKQDLTAAVTWASSDDALATVSNAQGSSGLVTGVNVGFFSVTAVTADKSGRIVLAVTSATLVSIAVSPPSARLAKGTTARFTATGTYTDATTQDLTTAVTWSTSNAAIGAVSNAPGEEGLAQGLGVGDVIITATSGATSGTAALSVTIATLVSLEVTPSTPSLAKGTTQQLAATGIYSDNSTQDLTASVAWASSDDAVAAISGAPTSTGLVTALTEGAVTITATQGTIVGQTLLSVTAATLVSIDLTPTTTSLATGTTRQFSALGTYTDGSQQDLTASVVWACSDEVIATISNAPESAGLATAISVGLEPVTISASWGAIRGTALLTVNAATLASLAITPENPLVANGTTLQLVATGTYTDGSLQDLTTSASWSSSDEGLASVSNAVGSQGRVAALATGLVTVTATSGDVTVTTNVTVTAAVLAAIAVTPANASLAKGLTLALHATGTFTDGSKQDLTETVTWSTSDAWVAAPSNATGSRGIVKAVGLGVATITAETQGFSGSTGLTVTAAKLVSLDVTPASVSMDRGTELQFTARGTYTDLSNVNLTTSVTWSVANTTFATVSNVTGRRGLVSALVPGNTTVYAASGTIWASATLRVMKTITDRCTTNGECGSGQCHGTYGSTPGFCCSTACGGPCWECSTGTCRPVPSNADPAAACGQYWCNGAGSCRTSCSDEGSNCSSACKGWCWGGQCQSRLGGGASCLGGCQCTSNVCIFWLCT